MINMNYVLDILEKICNTPSPSGYTQKVMKLVEDEFVNLGLSVRYTNKGGLIAYMKGEKPEIKRVIAAHTDTLGAMIKSIKGNGRIAFLPIGGFAPASVENENCIVHTSDDKSYSGTIYTIKPSVHIHDDARTLDRSFPNMEILLDERVTNADDVRKLGIEIGDFISFDPRFKVTESGYIKSRHLDDKASVAIILGVCKYFKENNITPKDTIQFYITNYEEVGHGASTGIPASAEELLCVDMGTPGIDQNTDEYTVSICVKDGGGPYDYELRKKLIALAKANNIGYKPDIYPNYGSDGGAALRAGADIRVGLIGAGIYASHGYERTHKDSVECAARLLAAYMEA